MLRCTLGLTVRYSELGAGRRCPSNALRVATDYVAARGGYHRAERPSIRGGTAGAAGDGGLLHKC